MIAVSFWVELTCSCNVYFWAYKGFNANVQTFFNRNVCGYERYFLIFFPLPELLYGVASKSTFVW